MSTEQIQFYLRHRGQISEWATLEKRADDFMRDAVKEGALDKATQLLKGDSGDDEVDFYVRNRLLITEWDALQTQAGQALHSALLDAAREDGFETREGKRGWTEVLPSSPELDKLREEHDVWIGMFWTKHDLLSTRRGYPFPRLALSLPPDGWQGETRDALVKATRAVAHELGMKKKDAWWAHWGMLDAISESQDLRSYADQCVARLRDASVRLYPVLRDAMNASAFAGPVPPEPVSASGD